MYIREVENAPEELSKKLRKRFFATKFVINKHFLSFIDSTRKKFKLLKVLRATEKKFVGCMWPTGRQLYSRDFVNNNKLIFLYFHYFIYYWYINQDLSFNSVSTTRYSHDHYRYKNDKSNV